MPRDHDKRNEAVTDSYRLGNSDWKNKEAAVARASRT